MTTAIFAVHADTTMDLRRFGACLMFAPRWSTVTVNSAITYPMPRLHQGRRGGAFDTKRSLNMGGERLAYRIDRSGA